MKLVGQVWEVVGTAGFSSGEVKDISLSVDGRGEVYVAFQDEGNGNKAQVMKYQGSHWVSLSSSDVSTGIANEISLVVSSTGVPFIGFSDESNGYRTTVKRFNGTSWELVGAAGFSSGWVYDVDITLDANNQPYVVYRDLAWGLKACVMRYTGSAWVPVGQPGFSPGAALETSIALGTGGNPYVAFQDASNGHKASVMRFNGTNWVNVGSLGFSAGAANQPTMKMGPSSMPYLAYKDESLGDKVTVMKFTGSGWEPLGHPGFSEGVADHLSFAIEATGKPLVMFQDATREWKATVMKFMVTTSPLITSQPKDLSVTAGQSASFTVTAKGEGTMTYQWQMSRDNGQTFSDISDGKIYQGTSTATLTLRQVPYSLDYYRFRVKVSNGFTSTSNIAYLLVSIPEADPSLVWQPVSDLPISNNGASHLSLAVAEENAPYLVFSDEHDHNKASVRKLTPSGWQPVTSANISQAEAAFNQLALKGNTPYVVFQDYNQGKKATVMKHNGADWEPVGSPGLSSGVAEFTRLAFDPAGIPLVAYQEGGSGKATVKRFTGTSWENVGPEGFSTGSASYLSLAFDTKGMPYVAFQDGAYSNKASVMRYDGTQWAYVSQAGFSSGAAAELSLAIDANDVPHVAFQNQAAGDKVSVMRLTANTWSNFWVSTITSGAAKDISLVLDNSGIPQVSYTDVANGNKPTIKRPYSAGWFNVGDLAYLPGTASYTTIALDPVGTPYLAFRNLSDGGKPVMMKYAFMAPPTITAGPESRTLTSGQSTTLRVTATGNGVISYKWQLSTNGGTSFTDLSNTGMFQGVTTPTLSLFNVPLYANGYQFRVLISNGVVTTSDKVVLTVQDQITDHSKFWQAVGPAGFSAEMVSLPHLVLDSEGIPYMGYVDSYYGNKGTIQKFNGTSWDAVGVPGFTENEVRNFSFAIDRNNKLYFGGYTKVEDGYRVNWYYKVAVYDGSSWTYLPQTFWSVEAMGVAPDGTIYLAIKDDTRENKLTVHVYNGTTWETIGQQGFSEGRPIFPSFAFGPDHTPFLTFLDAGKDYQVTVMKLAGSTWQTLGLTSNLKHASQSSPALAVDKQGTPYVAYIDKEFNERVTVKKFINGSWETVGSQGFSQGYAGTVALAIDIDGNPVVGYTLKDNKDKAASMKFTGSHWEPAGNIGISEIYTSRPVMAVDVNGVLYMGYADGIKNGRATVMKFDTTTPPVITAQPTFKSFMAGQSTTLSIVATGDKPLTYQWQVSHDLVKTFVDIKDSELYSGTDAPTLQINQAPLSLNRKYYRLLVKDDAVTTSQSISFSVSAPFYSSTKSWDTFDTSFSEQGVTALDASGNLYVALVNSAGDRKITVKKLLNGSWLALGPERFSDGETVNGSVLLKIDKNGIPYLKYNYLDHTSSTPLVKTAVIMKYNGNAWVRVHAWTSEDIEGSYAFDQNFTPYLVSLSNLDGYNNSEVTVKKLVNNSWTIVGEPGFSKGRVYGNALSFDSQNTPHIAITEFSGQKVSMMKFNGSKWVYVGKPGFSYPDVLVPPTKTTEATSTVFDAAGTIYTAFKGNGGNAEVMRYTGQKWENVGPVEISDYPVKFLSLQLDKNGVPFLGYSQGSKNGYGTPEEPFIIKKFNGQEWEKLGTQKFGADITNDYKFFALNRNDIPLAGYYNYKTKRYILEKYGDAAPLASSEEVGNEFLQVFPNPASAHLTINTPANTITSIRLLNSLGGTVLTHQGGTGKATLNLSGLAPGIYIAQISVKGQVYSRRVVVVE
ncbi:T9SS type A sorting domain-containing protein [Rufibacter quisquiliarum]|uniref:Ig-like domain-containing protein n=1 Tax=Rufibacter quisquiliarum TaxID=1549639 RepID=A0A839GHZ1_9BACT|nr:T9SS type A sorting domain-containing protein [Rufibacter quisquiliarum]MBA9076329.1 hypothetical protein [Rufibacter quisquiliarum]